MKAKHLFCLALVLALLIVAAPAEAQTTAAVTALFTEWRTWVVGTLAVFALLVGLVVAWIVAWRNLLAGAVIALSVLALGAVVGNYETIGAALGLG